MMSSSSPPHRRRQPPRRLNRVIDGDDALSTLLGRSRQLATLKRALWPLLPSTLQVHSEIANYRDSTLFFVADSPLWAARLRHLSSQILHTARRQCKIPLSEIKVAVVQRSVTKQPTASPKSLSAAVQKHLLQVADHADTDIATVLRRIANRQR